MNTALEINRRAMALEAVATKDDTLTLSFSSESPVARSFGDEVLSHAAGAVDLSRLNDGAPLLWNHDPVFKEIEAGGAVPLLMMRRGEQHLVSFI